MPEYRVKWEIDLEADSPEDAAHRALRIHRNPESIATVFEVSTAGSTPVKVDLDNLGRAGAEV